MPIREPARLQPSARLRLARVVRLLALVSFAIAVAALILVTRGESGGRAYRLITVALALGLAALLGGALIALPFLGGRAGRATRGKANFVEDDNDPGP